MKHGSITSIQNLKKKQHAVEAPWLTTFEEIQEDAISREVGIIMIDYLEQGRTINGTYYADKLRCLARNDT
jgi:hypothetical protein